MSQQVVSSHPNALSCHRGRCHQMIVLLLLCFFISMPLVADPVEVSGVATIRDLDLEEARRYALIDAIKSADTFGKVAERRKIERAILSHKGLLPDRVAGVEILSQEIDDGTLKVWARVEVEIGRRCERLSLYRKRIAITAFPLLTPALARGRAALFLVLGLSREVARRRGGGGGYRVVELAPAHLFESRNESVNSLQEGTVMPSNVMRVGERNAVQMVVTGLVRDAATDYTAHYALDTPLGEFPFPVGSDQRALELQLMVYDAVNGALIDQRTIRDDGRGSTSPEALDAAGLSQAHFDSGFGRIVGRLVEQAKLYLDDTLRCQPFAARVVRIEGDDIYIDAGREAAVTRGSSFNAVIITQDHFGPAWIAPSLQEQPAGRVRIHTSAAGYSIGTLLEQNALRVGDIVREP